MSTSTELSSGGTHSGSNSSASTLAHEHTTSVTRGYSDLNQASFLFYAFSLCALRTAAQQPMNLALARKQTCSVANSLSTLEVLKRIFRHEGRWRALRQGMGALTLGCALSEVIYLGLFEYGRERLPLESEVSRDAVAGYASDVMCRLAHIPLSIIAFRQMTRTNPATCTNTTNSNGRGGGGVSRQYKRALQTRKGAVATVREMYRERGLRSVFAGYGTTLVVGCQWTAIWWATYGAVKASLYSAAAPLLLEERGEVPSDAAPSQQLSIGTISISSGSSVLWQQRVRSSAPRWLLAKDDNMAINSIASVFTSATTAILFNPYLVLRTNLQVIPNATLWSVTRQLWRSRGLLGFYSGLGLNISACVVDGALASTSYEYAKLWADETRCAPASTTATSTAASPLSTHSVVTVDPMEGSPAMLFI